MDDLSSAPLFSCENLSLDLGGREILRDINLEIKPGEVLGIIGPNGAGKTSLLEILSGRYTPKTGNVFYKEIFRCLGPPQDLSRFSCFDI